MLINNEIGVHIIATFNGLEQPLKIFSNGFPNNAEIQENLAVYSEYMSGCLTMERLTKLAFRVIAVDTLNKGFSFANTIDLLFSQYKLNRDQAFAFALRVHRGGSFTKYYQYLCGINKTYKYAQNGGDLDVLLTGKVILYYKTQLRSFNI